MVLVADRCGMSPASLSEMKKTIVKALQVIALLSLLLINSLQFFASSYRISSTSWVTLQALQALCACFCTLLLLATSNALLMAE